ncbi:hypothetical protein F9K50_11060 [bacterium]|nr:MAG: hypothetical protein F9K50_11060 [bacterium]
MNESKISNIPPSPEPLRSFIQYDARGEAVVLRSNVRDENLHPAGAQPAEPGAAAKMDSVSPKGSMRLFGSFGDLKLAFGASVPK